MKSLPQHGQSEKSIIDQTTRFELIFLVVMAFGFAYDQRVSEVMYALGYSRDIVSNIWFIRNEYSFLIQSKLVENLSVDPFHVFELFVWVGIAINLVRIIGGAIFPPTVERVRFTLAKRKVTILGYFLRWPFGVLGGFLLSMFAMPLFVISRDAGLLLGYSPRAFVFLFAAFFAITCFLCSDGILIFCGLVFGKSDQPGGS